MTLIAAFGFIYGIGYLLNRTTRRMKANGTMNQYGRFPR